MKDNVLFSVIIPTYNTCNYIEQCVESFEKQNFNNFEIIICDDGSTDGTVEILMELEKKYNNIILRLNKHIGAGSVRNTGIELAKGEYIYFCDSDDYVSNDFFNSLYRKINNKEKPDILFFNYNEIIKGKISNTVTKEVTNNKYDFFYCNSCIWSCVYKKSLFIDNNIYFPSSLYHQDDAVYFKLIEKASVVESINDVLYNYRKFRPGSSMNTKSEKYYNDILIVAEMNLEYFSLNGSEEGFKHIKNVYVQKLFDYIFFNLANSSINTTNSYYSRTINILNRYSKEWKNNDYFYNEKVSLLTRIVRRSLRNKAIFNCYNSKIFKKIFKNKMESYQ